MINKKLKNYIEKNIIPIYKTFDLAHNLDHVNEVIKFSLILSTVLKKDRNISYTIACYHDIGLKFGRENHGKKSSDIVKKDENLRKWFNYNKIEIISQACEDHRASNEKEPRTIYGKIISDSDKAPTYNIKKLLKRLWDYRKDRKMTDKEKFDDMYKHMKKKYSEKGYSKIYLKETKRLIGKDIKETQKLINNKDELYKLFINLRKSGYLN